MSDTFHHLPEPPPAVSLRPVTAESFREAIRLQVREDQRKFVALNSASLAQMHFHPWWECHGAFTGGRMAGFVMMGRPPADGRWWIQRLMVGADDQGKGLGRAILREALRVLGEERGAAEVFLSFEPDNLVARRLYESEGFRDTGERDDDGEFVFRWAARPA